MKKAKLIIIAAAILGSLSSCGIFKKGCGCPTFGATKSQELRIKNQEV